MLDPIGGRSIPTRPTLGAISELQACAYFMELGWDVFRCQSPSAPFDMVIHKAGVMYRVEVKTATLATEGLARTPAFGKPVNDEWDVLCVVFKGQVIALDKGPTMQELRNAVRVWAGYPPLDYATMKPTWRTAGRETA